MSVLRARRKRAGTDPEEVAEYAGPKRITIKLDDGKSKIYVTAERYVAALTTKVAAIPANVIDAAAGYGPEVDLHPGLAETLKEYARRIRTARESKMPIIIHCREGRARSIISLGVYLVLYHGCSDADAIAQINDAFLTAKGGGKEHAKGPGDRVGRVLMAFFQSYMPGGPQKSEAKQSKRERKEPDRL